MTLPVNETTVEDAYKRIRNTAISASDRCGGWKAEVSAPFSITLLTASVIPCLRDWAAALPDSAGFPQTWKDQLSAYANGQLASPPADWVAEYDALSAAVNAALTQAVSEIPAGAGGYAECVQYDANGVETWQTLPASTALADALQAVLDQIS